MPRNEHHRNDILYVTRPTRYILSVIGAWPSLSRRSSVCSRAHNVLLICISYALLSCDLIPGFLYWLVAETARLRLQTIPVLIYDVMSASQYSIFILRYDRLRRCLRHVEEDWENVLSVDARNIMLKSARLGKRLVTICGLFMYTGAVTFRTILPLSQGKIVIDENTTLRRLSCPVSIVTSACGLTAIFVVHACGQLKILIGLLRGLVEKQWQEEREMNKKLAEVVEHQVRVRNFLRLVQHTLHEIYLLEILVNTITICLLVYFMLVDWQSRNVTALCMYMVSIVNVTLHIFLFCYTGEQLTTQAEKVATTSCELEWYRLPNRKARSVVLLIIMSNAPTKISGKFADLSLKTFGDVVKTAGAYFNMLRNVIE